MFKQLLNKKLLKNEKGLTLIELLAVIVILAIVAAIAIPAIGNIIENSRVKAAKADAANILNAANIYFTENPNETTFTSGTTTGGTTTTATANWNEYVTDKGTIETFTVTKASKAADGTITDTKVETSGKVGTKSYTIAASTLKELEIDKGFVKDGKFSWSTSK